MIIKKIDMSGVYTKSGRRQHVQSGEHINNILANVKNMATYFKHTVNGADQQKNLQIRDNVSEDNLLRLKQELPIQ